MKVTVLTKCFIGGGGNHAPGDELDIDDNLANKLILRGIVEAKKAPKKKSAPKKTNRAVDVLETPEDE